MIGRHEPIIAVETDLKKALAIGLDECTTALEESFYDLTDEQVWKQNPVPGRHNIGTLVMHSLENLNGHAIWIQGETGFVGEEDWFDVWEHSPEDIVRLQTQVPSVSSMRELTQKTRETALRVLEHTEPEQLQRPRPDSPWFEHHAGRTAADAYMRTIMHTMAHVRQVWCLRGALETHSDTWPMQHYA